MKKGKKVTDLRSKDDNPEKGTLRDPWTDEIWRETEPDSERLKYAKSPKIERLRCAVQGTKIKIQTPSRETNSPSRLWCKNKKFCKETFLTQNQAVLPRKNINNLGPSIASPHPDSIKGKVSKEIDRFITEIQNPTGNRLQSRNMIWTNQRPRAGNRTENRMSHLCSLNLSREPYFTSRGFPREQGPS